MGLFGDGSGEHRIDVGETFTIVGNAASGIGGALGSPSAASAVPPAASGLDLGSALIGALVGAGVAYATKSNVAVGAGIGGALALLVPGLNPIALGPGGV